jgi:tetratricopeptide (TPR) repeat protein
LATYAKEYTEADPKYIRARIRLSSALFGQRQGAAAIELLQQTLTLCQQNVEPNANNKQTASKLLLDYLIDSGRFTEAEPLAWELVQLPAAGRPIQSGKRRLAAEYLLPVLDGLGKHADAERVIRQIMDDVSTETIHTKIGFQWRCYLARALLGQNKLEELMQMDSELNETAAFLMTIESPVTPGLLGQIQLRRENHQEAERYLRLALNAQPSDDWQDIRRVEVLKAFIQLYEATGKSGHVEHYRQLLHRPSGNGDASESL